MLHSSLLLTACLSLVLAMVLVAGPSSAADFPPPDQLKPSADLPDPLTMLDGTKVTSKEDWESKRKPELKALFQHYMYGRLPPVPTKQTYEVLFSDDKALGGKATLSEIKITFVEPKLKHAQHVLLVVPNQVKRPPVFVGMNFNGNHALLDDPRIHLPEGWVRPNSPGVENGRATDKGRGTQTDVWNIDLILDRGYALASFYSGDIDPDTPEMADGIGPAFYEDGKTQGADDAATIALWAWGFHRVVDYLTTQGKDAVDASRIAAVGHSRNGKTALLAGAMDERIALVIPHQAGCGGTGPSRSKNPKAETVERINTAFPHWFCTNFKAFNENTALLPFDQHCLAALCAPRPVLFSNAQEDQWANPDGQFEMLQAATPVYKLYGAEGLSEGTKPAIGTLIPSRLGYFLRDGKHSMAREDWVVFLDYADKQLKGAKP